MSKSATSNQKPATESARRIPADQPSYLREEVVGLLGEAEGLKKSIYVKRRHIMKTYGISARHFRNITESGALTAKHFVFK